MSRDVPLSAAGQQRAATLAGMLREAGVWRCYRVPALGCAARLHCLDARDHAARRADGRGHRGARRAARRRRRRAAQRHVRQRRRADHRAGGAADSGLYDVVKASLTGSIIGNVLLVLGRLDASPAGSAASARSSTARPRRVGSTLLALAAIGAASCRPSSTSSPKARCASATLTHEREVAARARRCRSRSPIVLFVAYLLSLRVQPAHAPPPLRRPGATRRARAAAPGRMRAAPCWPLLVRDRAGGVDERAAGRRGRGGVARARAHRGVRRRDRGGDRSATPPSTRRRCWWR